MNILDKFNKVNIEQNNQEKIEHLDLQMEKEDYLYCKNIEKQYSVAYDLLFEYNNKIIQLTKQFATQKELDKWNRYSMPTFCCLCDYMIKQNDLIMCNNTFISNIQIYFSVKYKKEINSFPNLELINKKQDEKITLIDVISYIKVKHN
jgi:hypothetical protein